MSELYSVDGGEEPQPPPCQDDIGRGQLLEEGDDISIEEELRELNSVDGGEEVLFGVEEEGDEYRTCLLDHDLMRTCDNCHRRCFTCNPESPYYFDMFLAYSHNIKPLSTPLRKIKSHRSRETAVARHRIEKDRYHLCRECCGFLSKTEAE